MVYIHPMMTRRSLLTVARWGLAAALIPGFFAVGAMADTAFVDGFDDLPLVPGLSQEPGRVVQFDSPYGRILESWATGSLKSEAVLSFYKKTLPQLGWTADSAERFHRDNEVLILDIHRKGSGIEVHYRDAPAKSAP
jgi:hypothetical protein